MQALSRERQPPQRPVHPASLPDAELLRQCGMSRGRASGPGGQHRNKVATAVQYTHLPTGVIAGASERRSPTENERVALRRLRFLLAIHHRVGVPDGDQRSEIWKSRCVRGMVSCSNSHPDFPVILAELLDMLQACSWDHNRAALRLDATPSQLTKVLAKHPAALVYANAQRVSRGMRKLHG